MAKVEKNLRNTELTTEQRDKLEEFFKHIIANASVDYTNPEIQDIQTAMDTMLERIKTRVNSRGIFKIVRIVRAGSMEEKTSLWKFGVSHNHLEFDFLSALENDVKHCIDQTANCPGCIKIVKTPVDKERLRQSYDGDDILNVALRMTYPYDNVNIFSEGALEAKNVISDLFIKEINYCLTSSCDCLTFQCNVDKYGGYGGFYEISLRPSSAEHKHGCDECTVDMSTGTLHVNIEINVNQDHRTPRKCSLILKWISKARSLFAPGKKALQKPRPLSSLPIFVDFLPALEFLKPTPSVAGDEHDYFIVPKSCNVRVCDLSGKNWRKSWCLAEINAFTTDMSAKHRRCYQVMKYLLERVTMLPPSYHIKTVVLNHHTKCADTTDDCVDCVIGMLRELLQADETKELLSYQSNLNIIKGSNIGEIWNDSCEYLIHELCFVSATDTWEKFIRKILKDARKIFKR